MLASGMLHDQQGMLRKNSFHRDSYISIKFWNVKVSARRPNSLQPSTESVDQPIGENSYMEEEQQENPNSLKEKQLRMEQQVYRIWTCVRCFPKRVTPLTFALAILVSFRPLKNQVQRVYRICLDKSAMVITSRLFVWPKSSSYMLRFFSPPLMTWSFILRYITKKVCDSYS
jgi:hypothetical protein